MPNNSIQLLDIVPGLKEDNSPLLDNQLVWVGVTTYVCLALFILMLVFCLHNIWRYLVRQGKWRVFPLSMFYALSLLMTVERVYVTLFVVKAASSFNLVIILMPAVLKVLIGLV